MKKDLTKELWPDDPLTSMDRRGPGLVKAREYQRAADGKFGSGLGSSGGGARNNDEQSTKSAQAANKASENANRVNNTAAHKEAHQANLKAAAEHKAYADELPDGDPKKQALMTAAANHEKIAEKHKAKARSK